MQPKLKAKVQCTDREVGEISRVIVDPLSRQVSHIVVGRNGAGTVERQIPMSLVQVVSDDQVHLRLNSTEMAQLPLFKREEYATIKEVEIAHLEDHLHVEPGEVLVPVPELERDIKRRAFFINFTNAIGILLSLPLVLPVLKYLMKPMYAPFDNSWIPIGNVSKVKQEDVGVQFKFKKRVKEAFMPEVEIEKNVWAMKASPAVLESVYKGKDLEFVDQRGQVIWVNQRNVPYVVFSGKCPHLGCGYKWRNVPKLGKQVFICPCHLSLFDVAGKVIGGPSPRPLDMLPIQVAENGQIRMIDVEYKAGIKGQVRLT